MIDIANVEELPEPVTEEATTTTTTTEKETPTTTVRTSSRDDAVSVGQGGETRICSAQVSERQLFEFPQFIINSSKNLAFSHSNFF